MINLPLNYRTYVSPIAWLTPELLARQLDEFHFGYFFNIARTFEAIEQRDDVLKGVIAKRKKSPARLPWQIRIIESSTHPLTPSQEGEYDSGVSPQAPSTSGFRPACLPPRSGASDGVGSSRGSSVHGDVQALAQKSAVEKLLQTLDVRSATDKNLRGSLPLFIEQMMDCVGKKYSCHELRFQSAPDGTPGAVLQFVPLWFFENKEYALKFVDQDGAPHPIDPRDWIIAIGDGLMEASSIAYLYKHMPMRDWLTYCQRNATPGVKGITDALPGTPEWDAAKTAVETFGAEFSALLSRGADIQAIDLTSRGQLPYAALVQRMDQAMIALWRGADMTTMSTRSSVGASLQKDEKDLVAEYDTYFVADVINTQLIAPFIRHLYGPAEPVRVSFSLQLPAQLDREIAVFTLLKTLNMPIPQETLYERLGLPMPAETLSTPSAPAETEISKTEDQQPTSTELTKQIEASETLL
jgi:phage gp29-like protein